MATKRRDAADPTDRVVAAARSRAVDDGPDAASGGPGVIGPRGVGDRVRGQDLEPAEDLVPEDEGDDDGGLLGLPGVEGLRGKAPGADLLDGGEGEGPPADPSGRLGVTNPLFGGSTAPEVDAPDAVDAGVFDLVDQAGASEGDPLRSFLDVAESKLGRDLGLADAGSQTNASPADGRPSAASGEKPIGPDTLEEFEGRNGVFIGPQPAVDSQFDRAFLPHREAEEEFGPYAPEDDEDDEEPAEDHEDEVTGDSDTPHGPPPSPGPDDEVAPLPADLQAQLDADVARFRRLRPDSGDGTTDPSEIDGAPVRSGADLPDHGEVGQGLFGQPDTDTSEGGGGGPANTGADSQGAGVITPADDQSVAGGAQRDDDPFGDAVRLPGAGSRRRRRRGRRVGAAPARHHRPRRGRSGRRGARSPRPAGLNVSGGRASPRSCARRPARPPPRRGRRAGARRGGASGRPRR